MGMRVAANLEAFFDGSRCAIRSERACRWPTGSTPTSAANSCRKAYRPPSTMHWCRWPSRDRAARPPGRPHAGRRDCAEPRAAASPPPQPRCANCCAQEHLPAAALSIDDFYLPRAQREELARTVHPLLATRGVPGTHDVELAQAIIDSLAWRRAACRCPPSTRRVDDRRPRRQWPVFQRTAARGDPRRMVRGRASRSPRRSWLTPVNALERDEDPDGRWRAPRQRAAGRSLSRAVRPALAAGAAAGAVIRSGAMAGARNRSTSCASGCCAKAVTRPGLDRSRPLPASSPTTNASRGTSSRRCPRARITSFRLMRSGARDGCADHLARLRGIAPAQHLHPLAAFQILVVLEEVLDLPDA